VLPTIEVPAWRDPRSRRYFNPPPWLMQAVEGVAAADDALAPPVRFDLSEEALAHNSRL
jgi:hypothetical protein